MTRSPLLSSLAVALLMPALAGSSAMAADTAIMPASIGDQVEGLTFKDLRYLPRTLDDLGGKKAYVLVFTTTSCPLVQRYLPRLNKLHEAYGEQGIQLVAVNVGPEDTILEMASQSIEFKARFPFVKDVDGSCARALGVERTPEVAILDAESRLVYRGRIDDQYRLGGVRPNITRNDLEEAIKEIVSGKPVTETETAVDGCKITFPAPPAAPEEEITYTKHIARLMQQHCQVCHRPNTAAPFELLTYDDVAGNGEMIAEVVAEQRMPPWFSTPGHVQFMNDPTLSRHDRETIVAWVRSGMPEGDPADLPEPAEFPDTKWRIGEPDLVVTTPKPHELPADGYLPYKYAMLPHVFLKDTWVEAFEILPHNRAVVHHCNMAYVSAKGKSGPESFITGFVPGGQPLDMGDFGGGVAVRIPAFSTLVLQIHYVTTGKPEESTISVGLRFPRDVVRKRLHHGVLDNRKFKIPPHDPAHPVSDSKTVRKDFNLLGMFCHMHLRGKDMTFFAHHPDGKSETLLEIPNYSFDWQLGYALEPGKVRLPGGTRIEALAHFDNSDFNPFNPDPDRAVPYGDQTYDEMHNGFFFYTLDEEELKLVVDPKTGRVIRDETPPESKAGGITP